MSGRRLVAAFAGGVATVVIGGAILGILTLEFGWFDIAAGDAHLPIVRWFVHRVMIHGVGQRAPHVSVPAAVPQGMVAAGLCEYQEHCQTCHGGSGTARDSWANGLNPVPPYLIDSRSRWKPQELYWIISKGVKMTAMPSWKMSMSDKQIWSVVAYLENMPRVPTAAYQKWTKARVCPTSAEVRSAMAAWPAPAASALPQLSTAQKQQLAQLVPH